MNMPLTKFIAITSFALCANVAYADIRSGTGTANATPKNNAIADCVSAIQKHPDNDARPFLKNRGKYRLENNEHILNVEGWVCRTANVYRLAISA
ncbi:MAG: hypothetical protein GKR90_00605 [Pseudomonadales bacterium]|nr:hypothetical protein [Pseudomonadales bacterium]